MLYHDSLEERRSDPRIPHSLRINHEYRAASANAETGRLAPLYSGGAEQESLSLEERGEQRIKTSTFSVR